MERGRNEESNDRSRGVGILLRCNTDYLRAHGWRREDYRTVLLLRFRVLANSRIPISFRKLNFVEYQPALQHSRPRQWNHIRMPGPESGGSGVQESARFKPDGQLRADVCGELDIDWHVCLG